MKTHNLLAILLLAGAAANAGGRTSANYSITTDTADGGGITGVAEVVTPAEIAKAGYLGQLFEVTGLALNAAAPGVNETETVQLGAWELLDDTTLLGVEPAAVGWSVMSGPLTGISAAGVATADVVFEDTNNHHPP